MGGRRLNIGTFEVLQKDLPLYEQSRSHLAFFRALPSCYPVTSKNVENFAK